MASGIGIWGLKVSREAGKKRELMLHMGVILVFFTFGIRLPLWRELGELVSQFESLDDGVFRILE